MRRLAFSLLALAASAHAQVPLSATPDPQSSAPLFLSEFDGEVYALGDAAPDPDEVQGTWRTDGTPEGTDYLFGLNWRGGAVTLDGALYFIGVDSPENGGAGPTDLYRLDGETPVRLTDFPSGSLAGDPIAAGGRVFFSGTPSPSAFDVELYAYGPAGGVARYDLNPGEGPGGERSSSPFAFTVLGDDLYFLADTEDSASPQNGRGVWRVSPASDPVEVAPRPDGVFPNELAAIGSTIIAASGSADGLFRLEGGALVPLGDFTTAYGLTPFGGWLYFAGDSAGDTPDAGLELWRTDGTTIELVADIARFQGITSLSSSPGALFPHGGWLYFSAEAIPEGSNRLTRRLWRTDGTTTEQVPGIDPVAGPTMQPYGTDNPDFYTSLGDDLAFRCAVAGVGNQSLCLVDGETGRARVLDFEGVRGENMAAAGERLVFTGFSSTVGYDLHVYDPAHEPLSTLPIPTPLGSQRSLRFFRNVGLELRTTSDVAGAGSVTAERLAGPPADPTGIPAPASVACRWTLAESGGVTFDGSFAQVRISPVAMDACYGDDPTMTTLYWRPEIGGGAFTALTTDPSAYESARQMRYEGAMGFGEFALASAGVGTDAETAPRAEAPTIALAGANPVRRELALRVSGPVGTRARVTVLDALGREVARLPEATPGVVRFDASALAPGLYLARLESGGTIRFTVAR